MIGPLSEPSNIVLYDREWKKQLMATSSSKSSARKPATSRKTTTTGRTTAATKSSGVSKASSTQPKTPAEQAQDLAERAILVPVGASLVARDNLVSSVRDLATKYTTRSALERELKRYERRGAAARNRFERQVKRNRTRFERELRQRRSRVERTVKQNRRRFEREVRSVRRDLEKQSETMGARVERLVANAQDLLNPTP